MEMELFDTQSRIAVLEHEVKNVAEEIKDLRREQRAQHQQMMDKLSKMTDRVSALEQWRWMVIGGALACGYLLAHFGPLAKIMG